VEARAEIPLPYSALALTIMSEKERNISVNQWPSRRHGQDERFARMLQSVLPRTCLVTTGASG
jgi:hypothetical protein